MAVTCYFMTFPLLVEGFRIKSAFVTPLKQNCANLESYCNNPLFWDSDPVHWLCHAFLLSFGDFLFRLFSPLFYVKMNLRMLFSADRPALLTQVPPFLPAISICAPTYWFSPVLD